MSNTAANSTVLTLRAGDWVEVRSKEEILRTLDEKGQLQSMPFMPQMFEYCGRRMRVVSSAHKTCDTIKWTGGRSVESAVHLEGVRCNGAAYDGCEARCLIYWKTQWLKPVDGPGQPEVAPGAGRGATEADVVRGTRKPVPAGEAPTYVCQGTELHRASALLRWWDVRQYIEDYRSGNASLGHVAKGLLFGMTASVIRLAERRPRTQLALIAAYDRIQALYGGKPFPRKRGAVQPGQKTPTHQLDLQPGELVRVKTHKEILETIDEDYKNRGLTFDAEHTPYCGGTYRVLARINKIVNEETGKMIHLKRDAVILDGVVCGALYADRRLFCPRAIYPYWRECWLERVEPTGAAPATGGGG